MDDLETERLTLRRWAPEDGVLLARLAAQPRVMRHVGDGSAWPAARAAEAHARALAHWRAHDFGWRAATERATGTAIGLIALNRAEGADGLAQDDIEIGWWLEPPAWGKGYASEGARAIVEEAFTRVQATSVVARIQPDNTASLRVAAALGLALQDERAGRDGRPVRILRRPRAG